MTSEEKILVIRKCISNKDPMGLLSMGTTNDEYNLEAEQINSYLSLKKNYIGLWKIVKNVFYKSFDKELDDKVCRSISNDIIHSIDFFEYEKEMNKYEELKGKLMFNDDYSIVLTLHENFVIKHCTNQKLYINNKFYMIVEDQDLVEYLKEFATNNDIIYIQYTHKHFFKYFKKVSKRNYNYLKVKHKNDVELIFDINGMVENDI